MPNSVIVKFDVTTVPGLNRHRVSVWNDQGGLLRDSSAETPAEVTVPDGETIFVVASVPAERKRNQKEHGREEGRWRLRASATAKDVLKLGKTPKYGLGSAIEIRVDGAEQNRSRGATD